MTSTLLSRQINDLAALHLQRCYLAQIVLTVLAVFDRVDDDRIGSLRHLQRAPWMISLSSRLLAAFLAQALGLPIPRDTQRGLSKRAEMQKVCFGGESVILCHTESVLR